EHRLWRGQQRAGEDSTVARIGGGERCLESEGATGEQLRAGLIAARRQNVSCGADVGLAMRAEACREEHVQNLLVWEAGKGDHPDDEFTETDFELADIAEEAWEVAIEAAGAEGGRLGLVEVVEREGAPAVVRDLFETVQ